MTPERTSELVARWVRLYTRGLPAPVAERRIDEIDADLHDHVAHERANGTTDRRLAFSILARMVRGLAADASWRYHHTADKSAYRSARRVLIATACILLVPLVAMRFTDEVVWGPGDFAAAGVLLAGTGLVRQVAVRRASTAALRLAVTVALAAALVLVWASLAVGVFAEEGDNAPGSAPSLRSSD